MPRVKPTKATGGFSFGTAAVLHTKASINPMAWKKRVCGMPQARVQFLTNPHGWLNRHAGGVRKHHDDPYKGVNLILSFTPFGVGGGFGVKFYNI
jgi:hypothetical protein